MNPLTELHQVYSLLFKLEKYLEQGMNVSCLDCCNFNLDTDVCNLYGPVPPKVLVNPAGKCDKLEFVPF